MSFNDIIHRVKESIDAEVRTLTLRIFGSVIQMTPVGNPTIWKVNAVAKAHNDELAAYNHALRANPENLTSNGRLRRGLKRKDKKKINAPDGYVGGRAKGNWQCTIGSPASGEVENPNHGMAETEMTMRVPRGAGHCVFLTNNVPYIRKLEYDAHSSQAPAGMVRISIARFVS